MPTEVIVLTRPHQAHHETSNLERVLESGHAHGDGAYAWAATSKLRHITGCEHILLTPSCTHALELCSLLLELGEGDEVVLPSYTFPSAAGAVAVRGAQPVFVDVDPLTGNIDASQVESAITPATRAISIVHYGGVAADMDTLLNISERCGIPIIEDNAHGLGGAWKARPLGSLGLLSTLSFHDTKNVHCGEGGALLINDAELIEQAEILREKGTDRSRFMRGQVDRYGWVDAGSSYLLSELNAAVLDAQLDEFDTIQRERHRVWGAYAAELAEWADENSVTLMTVPKDRAHPAHLFFVLMPGVEHQRGLIEHLRARGIIAAFHYTPLHSSPAGRRLGRTPRPCTVSEDFSRRIVRLPLWPGLADHEVEKVIEAVRAYRVDR